MNLTTEQARQLASIFSRPVFRSLGFGSLPASVKRQLVSTASSLECSEGTVGDLFEAAFKQLLKLYRSEYVYKNQLTKKQIFGIHSPSTAALLSEFWVDMSKADTVVLNGTSTVYEIKTEFDNLTRLPQQLIDYSKVFDHINVVTHERGVAGVLAAAPNHVGVLALSSRGSFKRVRSSTSNIANLDHWTVFNCLRNQEIRNILLRQFGEIPETSPDMFRTLCFEQFKTLSKDDLSVEFVLEARKRSTGREISQFAKALPMSLRTLGLIEKLSACRRSAILDALSQPLMPKICK